MSGFVLKIHHLARTLFIIIHYLPLERRLRVHQWRGTIILGNCHPSFYSLVWISRSQTTPSVSNSGIAYVGDLLRGARVEEWVLQVFAGGCQEALCYKAGINILTGKQGFYRVLSLQDAYNVNTINVHCFSCTWWSDSMVVWYMCMHINTCS